ncbi:hypothetical protein [Pseudanabaena sp. ABRG5-3]|uniref:hypothetical protein n=1 Tax=Pseudanabaena sp. ABRG5-3 TaxID=685565 RepID=UPI000DC70463|nr:hypothetical protein [Pseudanabaena sp. ABRG5-3]BBC22676.1 hypothetical protein ABRG53_0419 [Pseudanabaena sp. ABRG5-3]
MSRFFSCPYLNSNVERTEEREQHINQNHPQTLPNYLSELAETLDNPDQVRPSSFDTIRTGRYLIAVTVTDDLTKRHWIITTYTARKITGGNSQ